VDAGVEVHPFPAEFAARKSENPDIEEADDCRPDRNVSWSEDTDTGLLAGKSAFIAVTASIAETAMNSFGGAGAAKASLLEDDVGFLAAEGLKRLMTFCTRSTVSVGSTLPCFLDNCQQWINCRYLTGHIP
jgi:hypothetical protein